MKLKSILLFVIILGFFHHSFAQTDNIERSFSHTLQPIDKISLADFDLYKPSLFTVDTEGNIALFDYGKYALAYLKGSNYEDLSYFSQGLGGGPREFRNPTDIKFGPEGKIWLADPQQARISVWNSNGKLEDTFNHDKLLPKEIAVNKKTYLIMSQDYSSPLGVFHLYDRDGNKIKSFGKLKKDLVRSTFGYEGSIIAGSDALYYAGTNSGFIKKYSLEGEEMYSINTIEPVSTVVAERKMMDVAGYKNVKVTKRPENAITASLDIATWDNKIYVLFSGNDEGYGKFIDVYDKKTGKYFESFELNNDNGEVYGLDISGQVFYLLCYNRGNDGYSIIKLSKK